MTYIARGYADRVSVKRLLSEVGADVAVDVLRLALLLGTASTEAVEWLEKIIENGECISLSRLKINGDILLRLGAKPRDCGRLLARIFDEVLCGRLENDPERLISYAERLINAKKALVIINQHTAKQRRASSFWGCLTYSRAVGTSA